LLAFGCPFEAGREAVEFMDVLSIYDSDKEKIYHLNAEKLLGL
jgi:predicted TIM-barrel fold metal-dependent hydrolase